MANAILSPAAKNISTRPSRNHSWLAGVLIAFLVLGAVGVYFITANWPYRYRKIHPLLEDALSSKVQVTSYRRTYFPNPGFVATGLTLRRDTALDLPPLGHAQMMTVQGRWRDLFLLRHRLQTIEITGLHIVLPPIGSEANHKNFPPGSSSDFTGPDTAIEMFKIHNSVLEIMKDDGKRLIFPIRELDLAHFEKNKAVDYAVDMQNAIPSGRIQSHGSFGPLNAKFIASTPVSGSFTFTSVNLHDVGNIAGTLSSSGQFNGHLGAIEARATSMTPDFAVDDGARTRVIASIECTVNGTNGDVAIHSIEGHTGATTIHASGSVQGSPKATNMDFEVSGGRAEDLLRPFIRDQVPITGAVHLRSHAYLAPSGNGAGFLSRLHINGIFNIPSEHLSDPDTRKSLAAFSERARSGKASDADKESASTPTDAVSSVRGPAQVQDGIASSHHLKFQVAGAEADLSGTFNFHNKVVHLVGDLRMDKGISHATTGFKSFLLKPLTPFFKKKDAGAVVPIAVTGGPGHYKVTQNLAHQK